MSMASAEGPFVPEGEGRAEVTVRRSRFIGHALGVSDEKEARRKVEEKRREYSDSSHVVYAFAVGETNSQTLGMSDDGEPKGTAGKPVLAVLKGSGVTNTLLTVVRYFGGTKLGTGGLVRAYGDCARMTLEDLPKKPLVKEAPFSIVLPYGIYEPVKRLIQEAEGRVENEDFGVEVLLAGWVPDSRRDALSREIRDLSGGEISFDIAGQLQSE